MLEGRREGWLGCDFGATRSRLRASAVGLASCTGTSLQRCGVAALRWGSRACTVEVVCVGLHDARKCGAHVLVGGTGLEADV
eukprot:6361189-Alexandrium_andersonii.AAC.1